MPSSVAPETSVPLVPASCLAEGVLRGRGVGSVQIGTCDGSNADSRIPGVVLSSAPFQPFSLGQATVTSQTFSFLARERGAVTGPTSGRGCEHQRRRHGVAGTENTLVVGDTSQVPACPRFTVLL